MDWTKWFTKQLIFCQQKYNLNINIRFFDYSDAYIAVKGRITVEEDKTRNKKLILRNNAPFTSCISKINSAFIENAEYLDIIMPMYNLLKYRDGYSMASANCGIIIEMKKMLMVMKIMLLIIW